MYGGIYWPNLKQEGCYEWKKGPAQEDCGGGGEGGQPSKEEGEVVNFVAFAASPLYKFYISVSPYTNGCFPLYTHGYTYTHSWLVPYPPHLFLHLQYING